MPPEGANEAYAPIEGEKMSLMEVDGTEPTDLVVGPEPAELEQHAKVGRSSSRLVPIKDAVKVLVFLDMLSVALVIPLLSSYFRDLNIR